MQADQTETAGAAFEHLVQIMARLRGPDGCPWDRQQTFDTLKPFLLEETYEVLEAIDARNWAALAEELGDLLLQPVFLAQLAAEQGHFTIVDALEAITAKLIRRHPHVFGTGDAETAEAVKRQWEEIKTKERAARGDAHRLLLESVPRSLPALAEAQQISSKAAGVGFDWSGPEQVVEKVHEELAELESARAAADGVRLEEEIGDLLFAAVNLARKLGVDAEQALRRTNAKFRRRFGVIEQTLAQQGRRLGAASLEEMEALWQQAKQTE
jgi:MazG family protein